MFASVFFCTTYSCVIHQSTWVQRVGLCPGHPFILRFSFPFNFKHSGKSRNRFFSFKRSTDGRSSCRPLTSGNQLLYMDHDEVCSHNLIVKLYYFREFFMEYLLVFLSFFFIFDDVLIISYLLYFCQHPKNILL